jgi:single-stranded-DNA-specific exonuclease
MRSVDEQAAARLASALRIHAATARCLVARGVTDPDAARRHVDPRLAALRPPTGLAGLGGAVERIVDAVAKGDRIGVFGDYDVDGVTTTALLTSFLRDVGAHVEAAVARRDAGYGFTPAAAADFADRGCRLIVTGDCGTSDQVAINTAAARGVDVVVIDHHTVPAAGTIHPALALVNPFCHDSTFPFRGMASVGLGFYVAGAVRTALRDRGWFKGRPEPDVRDLLDLVALGTVADLVPLSEENRILTAIGLQRLQARTRPGIAALLTAAGVGPDKEIDARTIGWQLAPRLNAPGRLGAAEPALALLLAGADTAEERATAIDQANTDRREVQEKVTKEALEQIGEADPGPAIVLAGEGWPPGVVGIVAAKLVEKYKRPAFVIGVDPETGVGRGSARTAGGVNLYKALTEAAPLLDRFGGHAAAAGFTVHRDRISDLVVSLGGAVMRIGSDTSAEPEGTAVDAEVSLAEVDERLARELDTLGPHGQGNPAPMLLTRGARVTAARRVGDGSHLKLTLADDGSTVRGAIGFKLGAREVDVGARINALHVPTVSIWQGQRKTELKLADFEVVP